MNEKESLEKLLVYQQDLKAEEECLKKMLAKFNEQTHALQVEQLHILNALNQRNKTTDKPTEPTTSVIETNLKKETVDTDEFQKLDLTVPKYQSSEEDEDEMEE